MISAELTDKTHGTDGIMVADALYIWANFILFFEKKVSISSLTGTTEAYATYFPG